MIVLHMLLPYLLTDVSEDGISARRQAVRTLKLDRKPPYTPLQAVCCAGNGRLDTSLYMQSDG